MRTYAFLTKWIIVVFYTAMMCIMLMQVFLRFVFDYPTSWAEEISRYLFIWIAYLGAAMGISKKVHIGVDYLIKYISLPVQKKIFYFTSALSLVMLVFVFIQGVRMTAITMAFPSYTMEFLPLGFAYLAIPAGVFLMMLETGRAIFEKIKETKSLSSEERKEVMIE